jgi:hypothetical protein
MLPTTSLPCAFRVEVILGAVEDRHDRAALPTRAATVRILCIVASSRAVICFGLGPEP